MPKAKSIPARARSSVKPTTKARPPKPKPSSISSDTTLVPEMQVKGSRKTEAKTVPELSKDYILKIILAKLESAKTCDWHDLSLKLAPGSDLGNGKNGTRGAKGKKGEEDVGFSGTELHDIYHNTILPGLKSGRALWRESLSQTAISSPSNTISPAATRRKFDEPDGNKDVRHSEQLLRASNRRAKREMEVTEAGEDAVDIEVEGSDIGSEWKEEDVEEDDEC